MFASHVCLGSRSMFRCVSDPVQGHTNVLKGVYCIFQLHFFTKIDKSNWD